MKKQKLINLFKIGILIFGISFLLTNCDKNNVPEEDIAEPEKLDISITSTSFSKADQALNGLREKYGIDNYIGLWSSGNTQGKTSTDKSGIVIYPDMVKKITRGDYTSYTMLIESLDDDPNTYYNLTVEEIGDSKGMFVTQYKNLSAKASAKTSLASKTSSSHTSISTKRIDDLIEPINKEDFNGSGGGSGGGGSTTYPTDCDGWVTSTNVAIETPCGCGHSWQQLLNGTCRGCQTNSPTWPSLETTTVYECILSSIGDTSNTGPSSPNTGGVGSLPPNEDEDGNELGGGSITTPVSPDDSSINVVVSNLDRELNLSARQIEWLNNNLLTAEQLLGFLIINKYSEEAKEFAINMIVLDMILDSDYQIVSTNKLPSELDSCCPGDCCPDVSLYSDDRIVYEYGIQPVVSLIDGSFNLIIATSEVIGSDAWVGSRIRKMMLEIGIDVPADIENEHLSELYRIRKRDNIVIVEYRPGLLKSMLDVGLDTLDVLAFLSPAKGGGPVLFTKIGGTVSITSISNHIRDIAVTSVKIDNAVNNLKDKAKYVLEGTGAHNIVKGHHPLAKSAFKSDKFYDLQKAFSISISKLDEIKVGIHAKITGQQNSLYSVFAKTGEVLTIEKMANIEIQAMVNAGVPRDMATGWVVKALENLKSQGVKAITHIPWNGLN